MKNGNPCPKCKGTEVYYFPGGRIQGQNFATTGALWGGTIRIARYVCVNCGFSEEWVDRQDDMERLKNLARRG